MLPAVFAAFGILYVESTSPVEEIRQSLCDLISSVYGVDTTPYPSAVLSLPLHISQPLLAYERALAPQETTWSVFAQSFLYYNLIEAYVLGVRGYVQQGIITPLAPSSLSNVATSLRAMALQVHAWRVAATCYTQMMGGSEAVRLKNFVKITEQTVTLREQIIKGNEPLDMTPPPSLLPSLRAWEQGRVSVRDVRGLEGLRASIATRLERLREELRKWSTVFAATNGLSIS